MRIWSKSQGSPLATASISVAPRSDAMVHVNNCMVKKKDRLPNNRHVKNILEQLCDSKMRKRQIRSDPVLHAPVATQVACLGDEQRLLWKELCHIAAVGLAEGTAAPIERGKPMAQPGNFSNDSQILCSRCIRPCSLRHFGVGSHLQGLGIRGVSLQACRWQAAGW